MSEAGYDIFVHGLRSYHLGKFSGEARVVCREEAEKLACCNDDAFGLLSVFEAIVIPL